MVMQAEKMQAFKLANCCIQAHNLLAILWASSWRKATSKLARQETVFE
jgi:hypothetical protein